MFHCLNGSKPTSACDLDEGASSYLKNDRSFVLKVVEKSGWRFQFASEKLRDDRDVAMAAIKSFVGDVEQAPLKHASKRLQSDREIVVESIKTCPESLKFAPETFKDDTKIATQVLSSAVNDNSTCMNFFSDRIKDEKEFALSAVKTDPRFFKYVSSRLKADRDVVFQTVKLSGVLLEFASDPCKNDKEVVREAIKSDKGAWAHVSPTLKADPELMLLMLQGGEYYFDCFLCMCTQICRSGRAHARSQTVRGGAGGSPEILGPYANDRGFVLRAVTISGTSLALASEQLCADRDVVLTAINQVDSPANYRLQPEQPRHCRHRRRALADQRACQ